MLDSIFKDWKTTLGGIMALVGMLAMAFSEHVEAAGGEIEIGPLIAALGAALIGFFSGDSTRKLDKPK